MLYYVEIEISFYVMRGGFYKIRLIWKFKVIKIKEIFEYE